MPARRALLVVTARHTPPGQLSWPAWQALRQGPVVVAGTGHPQLPALAEAGVEVEVVPEPALLTRLTERLAAGQPAVGLPAPGEQPVGAGAAGAAVTAADLDGVVVDVLVGAVDPPGARLLDVVAVVDRLRSPGGCPWDAAQTHASLRPYLIEEAYEAYQALEDDDPVALREELGDVLLQVVLHARLAQEGSEPWSVDDVAGDLVDKLVRRHPHVFAGASADDLEATWEAQKAAEKGRTSVTDGVPLGQPALALATTLQRRAARLGAPVPAYDGPGGALWELVRKCREQGVDPEAALRAVARRYRDTLAATERAVRADGGDPAALTTQAWAQRWRDERRPAG